MSIYENENTGTQAPSRDGLVYLVEEVLVDLVALRVQVQAAALGITPRHDDPKRPGGLTGLRSDLARWTDALAAECGAAGTGDRADEILAARQATSANQVGDVVAPVQGCAAAIAAVTERLCPPALVEAPDPILRILLEIARGLNRHHATLAAVGEEVEGTLRPREAAALARCAPWDGFASPEALAQSALPLDNKLHALRDWEQQERLKMTAADENMAGGPANRLDEVQACLRVLQAAAPRAR